MDGFVVERVTGKRLGLRAASGRHDAAAESFRLLMDTELDRSYRLATVILRDSTEAQDAVHDAAVSAWRRWADLREPDRASLWFRRIVINSCRDRLRRRSLQRRLEVLRGPTAREHPAIEGGHDQVLHRDEITAAMQHLSTDARIVVVLRYGEDLSVPEIASLLQIAQGTVKSRLHNAILRLRAALEATEA